VSIRIESLKKAYVGPDGSVVPILNVSEFDLAAGEQVALVGSSGCGKTTLLHCIAGIVRADSGRVIFTDESTNDRVDMMLLSESARDQFRGAVLGYIFQTHHLLGGLTALENVVMGMSFAGRRGDPAWARHLLVEVGLGDRLHYKPGRLSVGQQQRVAVARALANRPRVVLADEPTGALDHQTAQSVMSLIRRLCNDVSASLLLVTHDRDIASQFGRTVDLTQINLAARPVGGAA
jgi:ABC-type lipoprotein export system ATPase subunit